MEICLVFELLVHDRLTSYKGHNTIVLQNVSLVFCIPHIENHPMNSYVPRVQTPSGASRMKQ